jgi:cytoskeletal protein RodZ
MISILLLGLLIIGISAIVVTGSTLSSTTIMPVYSTPAQESAGSGQVEEQRDEPTNEPTDEQPVDEPEPEPEVGEPMDETNQISLTGEQQEQEQLALEIISSNGLVVINETAIAVGGDGSGSGTADVGAAEKEVTCVKNAQGQVFCYETLPTDEHCMKPIVVEDPPICLKGQ